MFGEDLQDLLVGRGVHAVRPVRRDDEAADDGVVLPYRCGHRGLDLLGQLGFAFRRGRVRRHHDEFLPGHGLTGRARLGDGDPPDLARHLGAQPVAGHQQQHLRVVRVAQPQADDLVAEEFLGAVRDGVQDLLERRPAGDRPLDVGELFEQPVAFPQRGEQALVLGRLPAFGFEGVQRLDAQFEHAGHAAQQGPLVEAEPVVAGARHEQVPGGDPAERRHERVARPGAGHVDDRQPAGDRGGELLLGYPSGRKAHGADQPAGAEHRGDLRLQGPRRALDGDPRGGDPVRRRGHRGEELRELLRGQRERRVHVTPPRGRPASGCGIR